MRKVTLILAVITLLGACSQDPYDVDYGVRPEHASFVPARIAVLSCRPWPNGARFKKLALTNVTAEESKELCQMFDKFILKGFEGQPFMRGISPKAVSQTVEKAKGATFLPSLDDLWKHLPEDCKDCASAPDFYSASISGRQDWRMWLVELSRMTKNADAVLAPFVTFGFQRSFDDRGILVTQRVAGIALFLIDTNSGHILWSGGREAEASNQILTSSNTLKNPDPPEWRLVHDRLFIDEVWRDFPGRQVYH